MLVFEERGKPEQPEKNLLKQRREPTTNSTHIWSRRWDLNLGHIGGRRAPSPLHLPLLLLVKSQYQYSLSGGYHANHSKWQACLQARALPTKILPITMTETRFYEPARLSTTTKPLFSLKLLDTTAWLRSSLSKAFHYQLAVLTRQYPITTLRHVKLYNYFFFICTRTEFPKSCSLLGSEIWLIFFILSVNLGGIIKATSFSCLLDLCHYCSP